MCIRDSRHGGQVTNRRALRHEGAVGHLGILGGPPLRRTRVCLLYTSDAADERSSVDLGGRRIIKKKNTGSIRRR